jgi:hypothetical protein
MTELNFPTTWTTSQTSNSRVTHCFDIGENNCKTSKILLTINKHSPLIISQLISDLYHNLSAQIIEEQHNMVEKDVALQSIHGSSGAGYYFMATDKNYNGLTNDWPYMMRCCYVSLSYIVEMTVLCYYKDSIVISQAMEWIKTID